MIYLRKVLDLVESHLESIARQEDSTVMVTEAKRVENGWHISYNTVKFVETGDMLYGLLGNFPLEVGDDGEVRSTHQPG